MNYLSVSLGPNGVELANKLFKDSGFKSFLVDPNVELVNSWTFLPYDQWNHPFPTTCSGLWSKFPRSFSSDEVSSCEKLVTQYFCDQCPNDGRTVALFQPAKDTAATSFLANRHESRVCLLPAKELQNKHVSYLVAVGSSDRGAGILAEVDSIDAAREDIEKGNTRVLRDMRHFITAYDDGTIIISGTCGPSPVLFSFGGSQPDSAPPQS